jgi:hypothetical protein
VVGRYFPCQANRNGCSIVWLAPIDFNSGSLSSVWLNRYQ